MRGSPVFKPNFKQICSYIIEKIFENGQKRPNLGTRPVSSPFVSIRIASCDDRIVSSLMLLFYGLELSWHFIKCMQAIYIFFTLFRISGTCTFFTAATDDVLHTCTSGTRDVNRTEGCLSRLSWKRLFFGIICLLTVIAYVSQNEPQK